ncbi:hypothetical protein [Streptomyces rimosus]|uniref:hypothetical protein n=1 Tax=Streptomyces rimosus TaxID=1927 RepID=UPI0004BEC331|nr:hypothetical protein [Streptomyces rimosus]
MTNTRKTAATTTEPETTATPAPETNTPTVIGPPLHHGQKPEKVVFAHHLRIAGRDFRPGESAHISPDYARQLRGSGYLARGRA